MTLNIQKLKGSIPDNVLSQISDTAAKFNITTNLRLAHFLSQCAHESGNFTRVNENLNYSVDRMLEIFKSDFDKNHDKVISLEERKKAESLLRNPEKIGNFVYANQNGNGPEETGDGYKFRGRGYIQLTGRSNYIAFSKAISEDLTMKPDLVATKYPLASAGFFFDKNNIWKICDKGDTDAIVTAVTRKINGGTNGLKERIAYFNKYYSLLK